MKIFYFMSLYFLLTLPINSLFPQDTEVKTNPNFYPELEKLIAVVDLEYLIDKINHPKIQPMIQEKREKNKKIIDKEQEKIEEKKKLLSDLNLNINIKKNYTIDIENIKSNIAKIIYSQNEEIKKIIYNLNQTLIKDILIEIEKIRLKNNYLLVLDKKNILALNPKIEITNQILEIFLKNKDESK